MKEWYGVDLDGTLAHYDDFKGVGIIGEPIDLMVKRVKRWLAEGKDVKVFTARVAGPDAGIERRAIEKWCQRHIGQTLDVVCCKDYRMVEFWDDRAVQVCPNTGMRVDGVIDPSNELGDIGTAM